MPRGNYNIYDENYEPDPRPARRRRRNATTMDSSEKQIRAMASVLRRQCRPLLPVRVYFRSKLEGGAQGECVLSYRKGRPKCFSVFIKRASLDSMVDALVHEWAHAISWTDGEMVDPNDHDATFGVQQARCWRALRDFD